MTEVELDQFLVDLQPASSTIVVEANWLQSQLKEKYRLENRIKLLEDSLTNKQQVIDALKDTQELYNSMLNEYRKMRVLNVYA